MCYSVKTNEIPKKESFTQNNKINLTLYEDNSSKKLTDNITLEKLQPTIDTALKEVSHMTKDDIDKNFIENLKKDNKVIEISFNENKTLNLGNGHEINYIKAYFYTNSNEADKVITSKSDKADKITTSQAAILSTHHNIILEDAQETFLKLLLHLTMIPFFPNKRLNLPYSLKKKRLYEINII